MSKVKVLLTGSTGFIGKSFLKRLLAKDVDVVCLVRKTSNIDFHRENDIELAYADLEDAGEVEKVILEVKPDIVVHAAASVMEKNEDKLLLANAAGTRNICHSCYKNSVGRLIYLSSIAVVGGNEMPLTDSMPYKTKNAYGRSKAEAEKIAIDFRNKGLPTVIIRPCMIYGEGEPHAMDKILSMVKKRQLPILDAPEMNSKLQLGYVDNIALVMELSMYSDAALEGTYIIADDDLITIKRFLEILYDEIGDSKPPVVPSWLSAIVRRVPPFSSYYSRILRDRNYDISRAKTMLGYVPVMGTEEGLRRTVRAWLNKEKIA